MHRPTRPAFRPTVTVLAILLAATWLAAPAAAIDVDPMDTRLLADPAVSAQHIAFVYAGDLWVAGRDGTGARRLTVHEGRESSPRFSPDGEWVAFAGEYDGNRDVYIVPVAGGTPARLTWHPGDEGVNELTPDGTAVLFSSQRAVHTGSHAQLFTVPVTGGFPEPLPIPQAYRAAYSPDGSRIAYTPDPPPYRQWKNYRGGAISRIWIYETSDHSITEIPKPDGGANDDFPVWLGDTVFFISDRAGELNLFSYDPRTQAVAQLTFHDDFPIVAASGGAGVVIYEQAGYLHIFDPTAGAATRLVVAVAADLLETRPRFASGPEWIRNAGISPSGARAVFEMRGEIVTLPAEKGDARNLTNTPGAHERSPTWSPDGRWIAYTSDTAGEYQIQIAPQDGKGTTRTLAVAGAGYYDDLAWSPDGRWLSFVDNSFSLYVIEVATGALRKVSSEALYGPIRTLDHAWSPDSRWLAYTRNTATYFGELHLYSVAENRSHPVTDGLSDAGEPVFDAGGKYLYFWASTDAGPVRQWFALSSLDTHARRSLYLAVLPAGEPSPLAPESDEEGAPVKDASEEESPAPGIASERSGEKAADAAPGSGAKSGAEDKEAVRVTIDFDGLAQRILALPLEPAGYWSLQPGKPGTLYYLESRILGPFGQPEGDTKLMRFDLAEREATELLEGVGTYTLAHGKEKLLYQKGESWAIADAGGKIEPGDPLDVAAVRLRVVPHEEWRQIYEEAWRINRDYFYDPGMHGADWQAMRERYAAFLPHLTSRDDLTRVMRWLGSELSVGHHYIGGGDSRADPGEVPGGLLGADYEIAQGRYRFARVFGGLNWNPELRAPLTEPGVEVAAGEYLLAVDGRELRPPENLYSRFENTAGRIVELTVGPSPDGAGARTVQVVPVESERALRNRAWVEANLARVDEATAGRVAYVYVPNTSNLGHTYFKRYFYPQAHKQAIIIDERYNGGGLYPDYYIDILRRPLIAHWAMRYGDDLKTPLSSIQGPKVMIIDENAGSGGDLLPWMFRKLELGTLVGRRTWGGLVGILGFPTLLDGGFITAPNLAIWTEDGWVVENVGVAPDVEVVQLPAEVIAGRDPQLEKAIEVALAGLAANPPPAPERPAFPVRVRQ